MGGPAVVIAIRLLVDGAVVREAVLPADSAVIGRGPESDFVIVDPSVSRRHARVRTDESGEVWIEDAESRNGLEIAGRRVERALVPAVGRMRCRLGAVDVEIALSSLDATLEIPARMVPAHGPLRALRAVAFWAAGVLAWVGVMVIQPTFWSPWEQDSLTRLSWLALGVAVGLPILAFVLIGLLRIVGRRARVSQALRAFSLVSWGWVLLLLVNEASSYLLTVPAHGVVSDLLQSVGVVLSVASLASVARRGPRRRFFLAWAVAIAFLLAGFGGAARLAMRQAGVPQVDYDVAVPVAGVTGPASSLDVYLQAVGRDFGEAERHAEEDHRRSESAGP